MVCDLIKPQRLLGCLLLTFSLGSDAQILIVDNLSSYQAGNFRMQYTKAGDYVWNGNRFQTDLQGYHLDAVTIHLQGDPGMGANNTGAIVVGLWSDVLTGPFMQHSPGIELQRLNGESHPASTGAYIYTPVSGLTLSAATSYWIVVSGDFATPHTGFGGYLWSYSSGGSAGPGSLGGIAVGFGGGWSTEISPPGSLLFSVSGVAVPEPVHVAAAVGAGLMCFAVVRGSIRLRRRRFSELRRL